MRYQLNCQFPKNEYSLLLSLVSILSAQQRQSFLDGWITSEVAAKL